MTLDFTSFSFEACLALLIALLAWGDQIRKPREAVNVVENMLLSKLKVAKKDLGTLINDTYNRNSSKLGYGLAEVTQAAINLRDSKKLDETTIPMIEKLKKLNESRGKLEFQYEGRYFATILLAIWFGLSGLLSIGNGSVAIATIYGISVVYDSLYGIVVIAIVSFILVNLVLTFFMEGKFLKDSETTENSIEVK